MRLNVKLTDGAPLPRHAKKGDAGLDLTTREAVTLLPGETKMVGTGVSVEIPDGYFGLIAPRSGMASKRGVTLANTPSVIDSGYRGEIKLALHSINPPFEYQYGRWQEMYNTYVEVEAGERVAQMVLIPYAECECVEVDELSETERGDSGFGSSGKGVLDA